MYQELPDIIDMISRAFQGQRVHVEHQPGDLYLENFIIIGVGITASTHLSDTVTDLMKKLGKGASSVETLPYLEDIQAAALMIDKNLNRAGKLIQSFKKLSVDQSNEPKRIFDVGEYLSEILISRIVAMVDVFDALATKRVYKDVWAHDDILDFIRSQIGIKFDPEVAAVFFENSDAINALIDAIQEDEKN